MKSPRGFSSPSPREVEGPGLVLLPFMLQVHVNLLANLLRGRSNLGPVAWQVGLGHGGRLLRRVAISPVPSSITQTPQLT